MSGQLRTLKNRIRSVENTKKITRAMEMVAAAKLLRYQDLMSRARPYTEGLENLLHRVSRRGGFETRPCNLSHPFLKQREEKKAALVLMTSDAGLCGSYNMNLIDTAKQFLARRTERPVCVGVGKMGITALKRIGYGCEATFTEIRVSRMEEVFGQLKSTLEELYLSERVDAIYVVYSHFLTVTSYKSTVEQLLPMERPETGDRLIETKANLSPVSIRRGSPTKSFGDDMSEDYIFEPSPEFIFQKLVPLFFEAKTRSIFLESFVSEQIARMQAMHQATENAEEMIDSLVLERNKVRQAAITKEIIEIVSGSRAAKMK